MTEAQLVEIYKVYRQSFSVSTDSRQISKDTVFFALKGPNHDGNKFALDALDKGAALAVVDEPSLPDKPNMVFVQDTLEALQSLALYHRNQLNIPFIGLTGSNGKTTTRELTLEALKVKYKVQGTAGNLNNHIGVPLTILKVLPKHDIAVIEMGANHLGEIARLCRIARPTHGLITNIGKAHIGTFGGFENVLRGKSELYQYLINNNGVVWVNSEDEILQNMAKRFKSPLFYPREGDYYSCKLLQADPFITYEDENGNVVETNIIGKYNFSNITAALCMAKYFKVGLEQANTAIADYVPANNRSQVVRSGTNMILLDAYNANPTSMDMALDNLESMNARNKIVILGDMNELGSETAATHRQLVKRTVHMDLEEVLLCGPLIKEAARLNPEARWFPDTQALVSHLQAKNYNDTLFLVKASRSIGLEKVMEIFNNSE